MRKRTLLRPVFVRALLSEEQRAESDLVGVVLVLAGKAASTHAGHCEMLALLLPFLRFNNGFLFVQR